MHECKGCAKIFERERSLNTHKRFCKMWQSLGLKKNKDHLNVEDRKKISTSCPLCSREFENVYAMSAHKGHCSGANSTLHLEEARRWSKGLKSETDERVRRQALKQTIPLQYIIDGNHPKAQSYGLKRKLLKHGVFNNTCSICDLEEWMGSPIQCELDHVNGNRHDHRLENLRMLCPNCHSQTNTFRGKNKGSYNKSRLGDGTGET